MTIQSGNTSSSRWETHVHHTAHISASISPVCVWFAGCQVRNHGSCSPPSVPPRPSASLGCLVIPTASWIVDDSPQYLPSAPCPVAVRTECFLSSPFPPNLMPTVTSDQAPAFLPERPRPVLGGILSSYFQRTFFCYLDAFWRLFPRI